MKTIPGLIEFLADTLDVAEEQITPEAIIKIDLWADEHDFSQLILGLEKEFDIKIKSEYETKIKTIKDIVTYIKNYKKDKNNSLNKFYFKIKF
jgi:acyl carrier protein